jgi:exopolysaccharide biosynthesis polyprenyl glycosylphosphotransferase
MEKDLPVSTKMSHIKPVTTTKPWRFRPTERRTLLILGDLGAGLLAMGIAVYFWAIGDQWLGVSTEFIQERIPTWFFLLPFIWLLLLLELYDVQRAGSWKVTLRGVATAVVMGIGLYLVLFFYFTDPPRSLLPRRGVAAFVLAAPLLTLAWRWVYIRLFTTPRFMRRLLVVGAGETGQAILRVFKELWPPPFYLVGLIDDDPQKVDSQLQEYLVLGTSQELSGIIQSENISDILVAISGEMQGQMFQSLLDAQEMGVEITRMPVMYEELLDRVPIEHLDANWILRSFVDDAKVSGFYILTKRLIDLLGGLVGLIVLLLFAPFVSLAILLDSGWPIFYSQTRLGRGGREYKIIKFRTMIQDAEADGRPRWAKEDDERATRVGRVLRKTHIDEIPQVVNVLRGEMSLVGPRSERPELVQHFQQHVPFYRARLLVKPGITGWAQVNFGYASTIDETKIKLEYDLYYIKHRNLLMDLVILLRTPWTVFGFRGR